MYFGELYGILSTTLTPIVRNNHNKTSPFYNTVCMKNIFFYLNKECNLAFKIGGRVTKDGEILGLNKNKR